jgi:hypothetical protein
MESHLSQKYSSLLEIEDVESLFERLKQTYGSIRKTADIVGVARSTAYGWEKARYLKYVTRTKILKASLETNLIETLAFLTSKSKDRTSDLLLAYLSSMYQEAVKADRAGFENLLSQIMTARREHFGLIGDTLQDEISEMLSSLSERATRFQISLPQDSLDMLRPSYLLEIMPDLLGDIFVRREDVSEIAKRYSVPPAVPLTLESIWEAVFPKFKATSSQRLGVESWLDRHVFPHSGLAQVSQQWSSRELLEAESADTTKPQPLSAATLGSVFHG